MGLFAGIVGLPNVGKSTLFNTITNAQALMANYCFATIDPNFGIVNLPDNRLQRLKEIYETDKVVPATFKFVDIAGLIEGASKGEGLGNKFLQNIREVDAICHVVRCFDDKDITHQYSSVDPIRDADVINLELAISDLEIVEKRLLKIKKKADSGDKESILEVSILEKVFTELEKGKSASYANLSEDEKKIIQSLNLITLKPMLYVANINESDISSPEINPHYIKLKEYANKQGNVIIPMSIKIEYDISQLNDEDKQMFMDDLGIEYTGLDNVIRGCFKLLNLSTFFTCGKQEVHAWTFKNGMTAPQCAGLIHTDFERGFIKAEVLSYDDLIESGNENKAKELGKMRLEGKTYNMVDGDICNFKFNVSK